MILIGKILKYCTSTYKIIEWDRKELIYCYVRITVIIRKKTTLKTGSAIL